MEIIRNHKYWRLLEILPGLISWTALLLPILLAVYFPVIVASIAIAYAIFWFFRSARLSVYLLLSYNKTKKALERHWHHYLDLVDHPEKIDQSIAQAEQEDEIEELKALKKAITKLQKNGDYKKTDQILHAILYVTYKESLEVIETSMKSYIDSDYDTKKMIFIFAGEERDQENVMRLSHFLQEKYGDKFYDFVTTIHPKEIPGEIKGKSANATWAAKQLKKYADAKGIKYENIMVSNFDADTVTHPAYFAELSYKYLIDTDRLNKTYQPTHMYHNNIWDVPMIVRMIALMGTFWRMAESMDIDKYRSFSSRSLSLQTTIDVDYWDPGVIPEDSRQYWTAYVLSNGKHRLVPIYSPLYMDAVLSETYINTFKSQYLQLRRWAWGACDFPFIFLNLIKNKKIGLWAKTYQIYHIFIAHFFWATAAISIAVLGWLPGLLNSEFRTTVLAHYTPNITSFMLNLAAIGMIVSTMISLVMIPKRPAGKGIMDSISLMVQWVFIPITSIFFSAIPALDAQTRLMFNKRLEYKVTEKARKP